jgi:hypothetical protein
MIQEKLPTLMARPRAMTASLSGSAQEGSGQAFSTKRL